MEKKHTKLKNEIFGFKREEMFFKKMKNLLSESNGYIYDIYPSSKRADETEGVDFYFLAQINGLKFVVPLQIKSGNVGIREHIKKYPTIPSLLYFPRDKELLEKCTHIVRGYWMYRRTKEKKYVFHINKGEHNIE